MRKVWLINKETVPHYRVPVYNYLSEYLRERRYDLTVVSEGVQDGNPHPVRFRLERARLSFLSLSRLAVRLRPEAIIYWTTFELYKFPFLFLAKRLKIKTIYWGHGRDLQDPHAVVKNLVYSFEHRWNDALILYAEHLKEGVDKKFWPKTFVANNTLNLLAFEPDRLNKADIKRRYGISAGKTIICLGRMQKRKRIGDLIQAFRSLGLRDVGLILAGPDSEGLLADVGDRDIFKIGPVYGEDSLELLAAADVFCLPGAIGLSIVDALYCGLPVVTEDVPHGPEIMYLKDGRNGFMVPQGDIGQLSQKLSVLLSDDGLRERFSRAARNEILTNGHIDRLCEGFAAALGHVCGDGGERALSSR